jgi:hypothetical protein
MKIAAFFGVLPLIGQPFSTGIKRLRRGYENINFERSE